MDASSLALGVAVEIDGRIVEDASWLSKNDSSHINMAELDAVIKGLNLALAWKVRKVELVTDSAAVHRWISDGITGRSRLKTKAASEMLIRRRVGIVTTLVEECDLQLSVTRVPSANNKADNLTQVPQRWVKPLVAHPASVQLACAAAFDTGRQGCRDPSCCGSSRCEAHALFCKACQLSGHEAAGAGGRRQL